MIRIALISLVIFGAGCTATGKYMNVDFATSQQYISGDASINGYRRKEATQFVEFCVELDNQDDRVKEPGNPEVRANIDLVNFPLRD